MVPAPPPRLLRGRVLLLDDHENLCGGPDAPVAVSKAIWTALTQALSVDEYDNAIVGLSGFGAKNLMESLPMGQLRLVLGRGPDGADNALIRAIDPDHVASRFDSVAIASGDHIFATLAWRLRDLGLMVCNVTAVTAGSSRALSMACTCRVRLKIDVRDRAVLSQLALVPAPIHGYEGEWIARHVKN
jgi:hypothetical protein